jgi:uncharacterized membrane protein
MKILKKWWFWALLILIIIIIILYFVLAYIFNILPRYQCGSTMGPNGSVNWCGWYKGTVVG